MDERQAVALSDANEHLIYAALAENEDQIREAKEELTRAQRMSSGSASPTVIDRLIQNDPVGAAAAGLISYPELVKIISSNPARYLDVVELAAVQESPSHLRPVVAARVQGLSYGEFRKLNPGNPSTYALAARSNRQALPESFLAVLREQAD